MPWRVRLNDMLGSTVLLKHSTRHRTLPRRTPARTANRKGTIHEARAKGSAALRGYSRNGPSNRKARLLHLLRWLVAQRYRLVPCGSDPVLELIGFAFNMVRPILPSPSGHLLAIPTLEAIASPPLVLTHVHEFMAQCLDQSPLVVLQARMKKYSTRLRCHAAPIEGAPAGVNT